MEVFLPEKHRTRLTARSPSNNSRALQLCDTMDIDQFRSEHTPTDSETTFQLENNYTLDVAVDGTLMAKAGAMVAYTGDLSFTGKSSAEGGLTGFIKDAATSEGTPVMTVEGQGHVYLADNEKKVQVLELDAGDAVTVNGEDVLAFESRVSYEIDTMDSLAGAFAGGFTNVYLEGPGYVAITTHADPLVLTPPVSTDPSATVAWSGTSPNVEVNKNLSDMVGQESGERFQMNFGGDGGFVVVQPMEEFA
jgi:uncharacterized protein (AIM24 family)